MSISFITPPFSILLPDERASLWRTLDRLDKAVLALEALTDIGTPFDHDDVTAWIADVDAEVAQFVARLHDACANDETALQEGAIMPTVNPPHPTPLYKIGEPVEIIAGEYAGLGGNVAAAYQGGYEVLVGGYQIPVATEDLAPDLLVAASEALAYLETPRSHNNDTDLHRLLARLRLALPRTRQNNSTPGDAHELR